MLAFGAWGLFVLLACNLIGPSEPPTLLPRATATPPPTLGVATLSPDELPQEAATVAPQTQAVLLNLLNEVETDRLIFHVDTLVGFNTRHVNSPTNNPTMGIGAARDYLLREFNAIAAQSQGTFSVFSQDFPVEWAGVQSVGTNVVGVIRGTEINGGILLLGAHYDSISIAPDDGLAFAPGANDNATGTAALIEIARVMSRRPHRATVIFVAFSAEEIGRKGSLAFLDGYIRPQNIQLNWMINMDIIGSNSLPNGAVDDRRIRVFSADPNEGGARHLARMASLVAAQFLPGTEIVVEPSVDRQGRFSDHMTFSDVGIPAVRFIEAMEDNTRQHTDRDTMDDIQPSYITRATQTVLATAFMLSDGPRPPQNISLRDEGNGLRTLVWEQVPDATSYIVALRAPGAANFTDYFETPNNLVTWDGFIPSRYAAITVVAKDANGMIGPLSGEYAITN